MNDTPFDESTNTEFTFDPTNKVVGIIDDARDVEDALRDLRAAGFAAEQVELLTDEAGRRRIQLSDEAHQVLVHMFRSTQRMPAYYDAPGLLKRIEAELLDGHYFVGVFATDVESRARVLEILKRHNGHFIKFYGEWAAEALEP